MSCSMSCSMKLMNALLGSLENQEGRTSENKVWEHGRHVSSDVVKEPSRIVASHTTRAGSIYTLAGKLFFCTD